MRGRPAALLLALLVNGTQFWAACAHAQAAPAFEVIPHRPPGGRSNRLALTAALSGVALVAGSFPLAAEADRRYERYLTETDIARIEGRFDATTRMDRIASATLITGEALLVTAVWLRFLRPPRGQHLSLELGAERCAVALRF